MTLTKEQENTMKKKLLGIRILLSLVGLIILIIVDWRIAVGVFLTLSIIEFKIC